MGSPEVPSGERKSQDVKIEETGYSEMEVLGLDPQKYELIKDEEAANFTRLPRDLYQKENQGIERLDTFLRLYGLNADVFDERENPQGLFAPEKTPEARIARIALLTFLNIRAEHARTYFGVSLARDKRSDVVKEGVFSPAYDTALAALRLRQKTFPLEHSDLFPPIQRLLQKIQAVTDLKGMQLFEREEIPLLRPNDQRSPSLEKVLLCYSLMVSGEYTKLEIEQRPGLKDLPSILSQNRGNLFRLTEVAWNKLKEKLKKGK